MSIYKKMLVKQLTEELASPAVARSLTRRLARNNYENFVLSSMLLPRRFRQHFFNVYSFCRIADDYADCSPTPQVALRLLGRMRWRLDAAFDNTPTSNLFLALSDTIKQCKLDRKPFHDLIDAFEQDQETKRYETFDQLRDYCRRSADPVGRIVLKVTESYRDDRVELSDHICTGLQLANHWQDIKRDWAIGRVYLPADEREKFGVELSMLDQSRTPQPLRDLIASECERAEQYFKRGLPLADQVPSWLSSDIKLFAHGGLETLRAIRKVDFDVLAKRPTVSKWRQCMLLTEATMGVL